MDGFYAAYMTGAAGTSLLMLVISHGKIVGADIGGMSYDGTIVAKDDGSGYTCSVVYVVRPGTPLITGVPSPTSTQRIAAQFDLPSDFADQRPVMIETPLGPVNAKFHKIRDL